MLKSAGMLKLWQAWRLLLTSYILYTRQLQEPKIEHNCPMSVLLHYIRRGRGFQLRKAALRRGQERDDATNEHHV